MSGTQAAVNDIVAASKAGIALYAKRAALNPETFHVADFNMVATEWEAADKAKRVVLRNLATNEQRQAAIQLIKAMVEAGQESETPQLHRTVARMLGIPVPSKEEVVHNKRSEAAKKGAATRAANRAARAFPSMDPNQERHICQETEFESDRMFHSGICELCGEYADACVCN